MSFVLQSNLKQFMDLVRSSSSEKITKLTNKGLDPNYYDYESGGLISIHYINDLHITVLTTSLPGRSVCQDPGILV